MVLVIPAIAPTLHGTQLREFLLPITQHMRLDAAQFSDLTDGEVAFGRNDRKVTPMMGRPTKTLNRLAYCRGDCVTTVVAQISRRSDKWFTPRCQRRCLVSAP